MAEQRTVVVTGASSGIGTAAALAFARAGDDVVLLGRHPGRLADAVARVTAASGRRPLSYRADFAVLDEVRAAGAWLAAERGAIAVLVNNAGQLVRSTRPTVDGHDPTLQVNHLAGFLLAHLLVDRLRAAARPDAPARIVTTGSLAEAWGWLDVDRPVAPLPRYRSRWLAYGASKQANLLFTVEAARRWAASGVVPTCFFPGLIQSRFGRNSLLFSLAKPVPVLFQTPEQGADTLVWLATDEAAVRPGEYFAFRRPFFASPRATDPHRAGRLWAASAAAAGLPAADPVRPPAV